MINDIKNELKTNFIEYAVAVNTDRAIPDAKSGLKPVAKRILWSSYESGFFNSKTHVKAATIVGNVIGQYHPHGDSSIYGALVRLSQPWTLRYPLIDWHGNNGNIAGDPPAHYRYTEAKLTKLAEEGMLANIKKRNVEFGLNFSDTLDEPITLPAIFPNLLCNPNTGIGVALACNWAPHNLGEVAQAIYDYMDGKEPMIPGPDFPTGGVIINKNDIPAIMRTGHGSVKVRGKYNIEKNKIIFYEIPYGLTIEGLLEEIGAACDAKEIEGIAEIQDQSNRKGLRIVIECEKCADPNRVVARLFAKTNLQTSFSYNQVALIDKVPTEMNLKKCCEVYVNHNIDCLKRETEYDLNEAKKRAHIVEGLLIALEDIDNVITLIKKSADSSQAKERLIEKYSLSEAQAKAILAMRLSSLAHLEKIELENEHKGLLEKIANFEALLNSADMQKTTVRERLENIVKKFGDARRTDLMQIDLPASKEEKEIAEVEPEKCVVILTENNTIKRIPIASFRTQRRAGKGIKTQEDITSMVLRTNTVDSLMVFTNQGRMYRLLVDNIPEGTNVSKGTPVSALIEMQPNENVAVIYSIYRDTKPKYVLFTTKNGVTKKTPLEEYIKTKKKTGIAAINIREDDELVNVCLINDEDIIYVTKQGHMLRCKSTDISISSRVAIGIKAMSLGIGDEIITALPVRDENDSLAIFTECGLGKKIPAREQVSQGRGGKGVICYKPTESSGDVIAATLVNDEDNILVVGDTTLCVSAKDIPSLGRAGIGNIIIKGTIKAVSKV